MLIRRQARHHLTPFASVQVKGNVYKNKRVLMEAVHEMKAEKMREKTLADQLEARRSKNKAVRARKIARREDRIIGGAAAAPAAEAKK